MRANAVAAAENSIVERGVVGTWLELIKVRLTTLVLLTTAVGFYVATSGPVPYVLFFNLLVGTALVASGAAALNQLVERDHDARMPRTEGRPLPSRRLTADAVLIFGGLCSVVGMVQLAWMVNFLTALLAAFTLSSYLFVYTPLKRRTVLNTVVGAIPGAVPPLMGWTGAENEISVAGWSLFSILFFWQLPHFLAIAWMYRDEYARAGYVMLPVVDPTGERTGRQAISHTLGLIPVSLCPFLFHLGGVVYLAGALILGALFLWSAIRFSARMDRSSARALFFASIIYLPLLLGLLVLDKVR